MRFRKRYIPTLVGFALVLIALLTDMASAQVREKVRIGFFPGNVNALPYIAEKQGFFSQEGLAVTLREYPTGKQALKGMYDGEVKGIRKRT